MGINRLTALTVQGWPDTESTTVDGIYAAAGGEGSSWSSFLYLVKNGDLHSLLLSSKPVFKSEEAALSSIKGVVAQLRELDLDADELFTKPSEADLGGG